MENERGRPLQAFKAIIMGQMQWKKTGEPKPEPHETKAEPLSETIHSAETVRSSETRSRSKEKIREHEIERQELLNVAAFSEDPESRREAGRQLVASHTDPACMILVAVHCDDKETSLQALEKLIAIECLEGIGIARRESIHPEVVERVDEWIRKNGL